MNILQIAKVKFTIYAKFRQLGNQLVNRAEEFEMERNFENKLDFKKLREYLKIN